MASLAWVAWSLSSFSCCCCSRLEMLLSCSLICSSTVTPGPSGGRGGATTSAMLHTRCFSPFLAHVGVSETAAEPKPDTACSVRSSKPLVGGGVSSRSPSMGWRGRGCDVRLRVGGRRVGARGHGTRGKGAAKIKGLGGGG